MTATTFTPVSANKSVAACWSLLSTAVASVAESLSSVDPPDDALLYTELVVLTPAASVTVSGLLDVIVS